MRPGLKTSGSANCSPPPHTHGMTIKSTILVSIFLTLGWGQVTCADVHMANGIKIGEVDADSAIIWTRLTAHPDRNTQGTAFISIKDAKKQPQYPDLSSMQGSVTGAAGDVRVTYWPTNAPKASQSTEWVTVYPNNDYTHQFELSGLSPKTHYSLLVEGTDGGEPCKLEGQFRTAPSADQASDIRFVVTTCGDYPRRDDPKNGHKIYPQMLALDPDFFRSYRRHRILRQARPFREKSNTRPLQMEPHFLNALHPHLS